MTDVRALALIGPTASGKSALALALARHLGNVDIISVDSMQVYRRMDIGTSKPTAAEQADVRHHVIDLVEPSEEFTVVEFQEAERRARAEIAARGAQTLYVGGTGLYVRAAVDELNPPPRFPDISQQLELELDTRTLHERLRSLDPAAALKMEPGNRRRVVRALEVTLGTGRPFSSFGPGLDRYPDSDVVQIGLRPSRADLSAAIRRRFDGMLARGLVEEVRALAGGPLSRTARQALGYKELLEYVGGRTTLADAVELAVSRTRSFAIRQERWFRRDPRIVWFDADPNNPASMLPDVLAAWRRCLVVRQRSR